ncbi:hypothetical protein FPSE5266_04016 [Fusarium pseudograminearum]|nr:hypothetical protein FPSE5266_04016 [Fusarium pseudograminearum]
MAEKPDVTVAIDLGTTFTGVGFLFSNGTMHIFNNWPGNNSTGETKVPSRIVYNHDNTVSSWGFYSSLYDDPLPPGKKEHRLFKMFLDKETCEEARRAGLSTITTTAEASKCATDFLQQIYRHIKITYEEMTGANWTTSAVTFLFSVPTTWRGLDVSNTFKAVIRAAGYGTEGPRHSAQIDLTEAEAAAVDTLKSGVVNFNTGDVFLTIDAGGGTTDFSLVQVTSIENGRTQMSQIAEVAGIGIGSTLIDSAFGKLVQERLANCPDVPFSIANGLAENMMKSERFKVVKHLFGDPAAIANSHKIPMPGVPNNFRHTQLGADGGCMKFDNHDIQRLFDPHVKSILVKVREQLDWMVQNNRSEQVMYIALSGGLGSSKHVQRQLREHFVQFRHPNCQKVRVIVSKNPQTTVVRGLLEDQKQKRETGNKPVLATYIARMSYGIVIREPYNPMRHVGEQLETDEFDSAQRWAVNQIEWFIRKGDNIDPTMPIMKPFSKRLSPGLTTASVTVQVVSSRNESSVLPQSLLKAGVKRICQVECTLTGLSQNELVFDVALAGPCKPHETTIESSATVTTVAPTTSETKGPLVIRNVIGNGNFAVRDPTNPSNIPNYTIEGDAQIVEDKGYTADNSKERGCVELQASNQPPSRKRAIGNIVSISQQLDSLDTKKKYTVRFFYAVITASSINVCTLTASIAGHVFYTSTILSLGAAMDWNTVLEQTDVPNTEGAFAVAVNCPVGGVAAIYIDSIFMSNQVTPDTINDVAIDFGNDGSSVTTSGLSAVSTTYKEASSSANTDGPSTETEPLTESHIISDSAHPTSGFFTESDVNTISPSTKSETETHSVAESETEGHTAGVSTASELSSRLEPSTASQPASQPATQGPSTASEPVTEGPSTLHEPSTASEPATQDPSTESDSHPPTLTLNPTTAAHATTASDLSTASSLPTGSRVCPVGAAPPGYCAPVEPRVTQTVSLAGIQQESENERPTAPRACWAFGRAKFGTWGRTLSSNPRQNSIEDCALLCKQEGSACKAFAWDGARQEASCRLLSDSLGVAGIDINSQNSLMWNDLDCFECQGCDIKNPVDVETTTAAPSTTSLPDITTSAAPVASMLCPHCHLQSSPSSALVCQKIGNLGSVDLQPYANNVFDKATMQTTSEQCATICFILKDCKASAYDSARRRCIFTNTAISSSAFQEAQDQDASAYILPWSSKGCWSCSNDCSTKDETTSQAPSSTEHTVEPATTTPTRTQPPTTFISSYAPTTTEASMPQCTLALSDGCTFDQNNYDYSQCSKSGTLRNTFTLRDDEYPWQMNINSYQNCVAMCNQMPSRCKASAWDQNSQQCVFSTSSIFTSAFTQGNDDGALNWSEQSCFLCFCHDQDRDEYSASLRTALPTATCAPSITSEDAVCQLRPVDNGAVVCQHTGYFPWSWDDAPSKFPNQDSEERCAALCNSNPDCMSSGWSEEYGKCALSGFQLTGIAWQQFGNTMLSWSDKGCWDCSDCIKSQKWRIIN